MKTKTLTTGSGLGKPQKNSSTNGQAKKGVGKGRVIKEKKLLKLFEDLMACPVVEKLFLRLIPYPMSSGKAEERDCIVIKIHCIA